MKEITKSAFQFSNPKVKRINFEIHEDFQDDKYNGIPIKYNMIIRNKEESEAVVDVTIVVGNSDCDTPFFIELIISSKFRWTDDVEAPTDSLLKTNAPTLLISYARPIIAHLTADAGIKPFNLPFVDLRRDFANE